MHRLYFMCALSLPVSVLTSSAIEAKALESKISDPKIFDDRQVWLDANNHPVKLSQWLNHGLVVVSMAYAACQRTCPMTFSLIHDIEVKLAATKRSAEIVIISLDPEHDWSSDIDEHGGIVNRLKNAAEATHGVSSKWHFLRGDQKLTASMATALGVDAYTLDDHIVHKFKIWVFDPHGRPLFIYDWQHRNLEDL